MTGRLVLSNARSVAVRAISVPTGNNTDSRQDR